MDCVGVTMSHATSRLGMRGDSALFECMCKKPNGYGYIAEAFDMAKPTGGIILKNQYKNPNNQRGILLPKPTPISSVSSVTFGEK